VQFAGLYYTIILKCTVQNNITFLKLLQIIGLTEKSFTSLSGEVLATVTPKSYRPENATTVNVR